MEFQVIPRVTCPFWVAPKSDVVMSCPPIPISAPNLPAGYKALPIKPSLYPGPHSLSLKFLLKFSWSWKVLENLLRWHLDLGIHHISTFKSPPFFRNHSCEACWTRTLVQILSGGLQGKLRLVLHYQSNFNQSLCHHMSNFYLLEQDSKHYITELWRGRKNHAFCHKFLRGRDEIVLNGCKG